MDFLSSLVTFGTVIIGILYGLGFVIVSYNLGQRGISEYQLLNSNYIEVGVNFIVIHILFVTVGWAFFFVIPWTQFSFEGGLSVLSLFSFAVGIVFYTISARSPRWSTIKYFFILAAGSILGSSPLSFFIEYVTPSYLNLAPLPDISFPPLIMYIVFAAYSFFILGQLVYYSRFYYGRTHPWTKADRFGYGAPQTIQLAFDKKEIKQLIEIGIPVSETGITEALDLIYTTPNDYIISLPNNLNSSTAKDITIKIPKVRVSAVIYHNAKSEIATKTIQAKVESKK
jgi:hypothetical protein